MYVNALILTIGSNILYHIFQKLTPGNLHPMIALMVTYLTAAILCAMLMPLFPGQPGILASLKQINWSSIALGAAIVGLEAGFLLAYRAGWNISLAAGVSNVALTVLLIPIGLLFFHEKLTTANWIGMVLCLAGLVLINMR
ncbi:MAG: EamA family transporter [Anaerolineales bacterium]|nr:EamA family transporter [Anaerolineales bacterium]